MFDVVEKLYFKSLIPTEERDENYLIKLCISALAEAEGVAIPDKFRVEFNHDNPLLGDLVCLPSEVFFAYATSVFLDREKAYSTIKKIDSTTIDIGLNLLMLLDAIVEESTTSSAYERYKEAACSLHLSAGIFDETLFEDLVDAVLYLPVDYSDRTVKMSTGSSESGNAIEAASLMKNTLRLSLDEQISFLFYEQKTARATKKKGNRKSFTEEQCQEIVAYILSQVKAWESFKKNKRYVKNATDCVIAIENTGDVLPVLKALEVYKKTDNYTKTKKDEESHYCPGNSYSNSTALIETCILSGEIRALSVCEEKDRHEIVIINASFTLIESILKDRCASSVHIV